MSMTPWGDIINSVTQIGTSVGNALWSGNQNRINRKFQERMLDKQIAYNREAYRTQRADALRDYAQQRKDYASDLELADLRSTNSRRNAGLSTAFSNGYSAAQPLAQDIRSSDMPSVSPPSGSTMSGTPFNVSLSPQWQLAKQQQKLIDAQILKLKSDTKGQNITNDSLQLELDKARETFNTDIDTKKANLDNILSQTDLNRDKRDEIAANINKLSEEANSISFDVNKIKPQQLQNLRAEWHEIFAKINNLNSQSSVNALDAQLKKIQKHFNEMGIGVGSGLFDSVLGLLTSGNGTKTFKQLKDFVSSMFNGLLTIDIPSVTEGIGEGINKLGSQSAEALDKFWRSLLGDKNADSYLEWLRTTKFGKTLEKIKGK